MPRTNRNTLKEYFKRGNMPEQRHFAELIDSMLNIADDGIDKTPDDGLRLAPLKANDPVVSLFRNIQDSNAEWQLSLGESGQLHVRQKDDEQPYLVLHPSGRIDIPRPGMDIHIDGAVSARSFEGETRGEFPANSEWHTIDIPTDGCRAYRIMAGCGKIKSGQYALVEATAMHCYGKHRRLRTTSSWFGSFFNKIKFRWQGTGQKCRLQIRTARDYGTDIFLCYQLTELWGDPKMNNSDRRQNTIQE